MIALESQAKRERERENSGFKKLKLKQTKIESRGISAAETLTSAFAIAPPAPPEPATDRGISLMAARKIEIQASGEHAHLEM